MRKRLSFMLVAALILALLAACGGGSSNNSGTSNTSATTGGNTAGGSGNAGGGSEQTQGGSTPASSDKPQEPVTLTAMVQNHPAFPFREDWMIWDVYKHYRNVTLDVSAYQGNWWETIPLVIASGDLPDLMWMSGTDNFHKYGNEGALIDLNEHLDKMPNLKKFIEEHPAETAIMLSAEGKLYMPPSTGAYAANSSIFMYRADIFEKHNLKAPSTLEELKETLRALKRLYPDSYPLMVNRLNNMIYGFASLFGTGDGIYHDAETDSMRFGPLDEGFRQMVQYFSELYAEELIPIDFLTLDSAQLNQLMTTDGSFIYYGYTNNIDTYNQSGQETNPDFQLKAMVPPEGPGGRYNGTTGFITEGLTITSTTKKLDEALAFLDWLYSDEGMEAVSWGIEGVSYEVVNGQKKYVDAITDLTVLTRDFGIKSSGNYQRFNQDAWMTLLSEQSREAQQIALDYMRPMRPDPALTAEEQESIQIKRDAVGKYFEENISKFIVGQRPMSEYDAYLQGLKDLGAEDILAVYQKAYERQKAQLGN
jgi:putative aldouronate transport system substrate-binding protein